MSSGGSDSHEIRMKRKSAIFDGLVSDLCWIAESIQDDHPEIAERIWQATGDAERFVSSEMPREHV